MLPSQTSGREKYDADIAARLSLLAEQALITASDALQAMRWAAPGDDELEILYIETNRLSDRLDRYRVDEGHDKDR